VVVEDPAGGVTGILCSGDDVTDARRAEEEARERMMHLSRLATMGEMATGTRHQSQYY
jgi:hypothetical protein